MRSFVFIECTDTKETPFQMSIYLAKQRWSAERKGDCNWSKTLVWHWIAYVWFRFSTFCSFWPTAWYRILITQTHAHQNNGRKYEGEIFHILFLHLFCDWVNFFLFRWRWNDALLKWKPLSGFNNVGEKKKINMHAYYSELGMFFFYSRQRTTNEQ